MTLPFLWFCFMTHAELYPLYPPLKKKRKMTPSICFPFSCTWSRKEFPFVAHAPTQCYTYEVTLSQLITMNPSQTGRVEFSWKPGKKPLFIMSVNDLFTMEVTALIAPAC